MGIHRHPLVLLLTIVAAVSCANDPAGGESPPLARRDLPERDVTLPEAPDRDDGGSTPPEQAHAKLAPCPSCTADFALYDPQYEDDGVWEDEVTALVTMFDKLGWSYERVGTEQINAGVLGSGDSRRFRGLVAPGGWAWWRNRFVTPSGESSIRAFVESGGNFVGFCAGAYWAADTVTFAEGDRDYRSYDYDMALWPGELRGPLAWIPWNGGTNANLSAVAMDSSNPTMAAAGVPGQVLLFYGGGPWFVSDSPPADLEVWGRAVAPAGSEGTDGDGEPTIVRYHLGAGNVILFAYHPEILIDSEVDGVTLQSVYPEEQMSWDTGGLDMDEVNLQSWNVAHAALQVAADEQPTPLAQLP